MQKIQAVFIDDIDGTEAAGTTRFSLDGTDYEIDLNEENTAALHTALEQFVKSARTVSAPARKKGTRTAKASPAVKSDASAIRVWAAGQGIRLSSRGRIPADVVGQYQAANG